jgi:hypothetical protein
MNEGYKGVFAVRTEQTLLVLLFAVSEKRPRLKVSELVDVYETFQNETGVVFYGSPLRPHREALETDLRSDINSLREHSMLDKVDDVQISMLALPAASSFRVVPPLDRLIEIARQRLRLAA